MEASLCGRSFGAMSLGYRRKTFDELPRPALGSVFRGLELSALPSAHRFCVKLKTAKTIFSDRTVRVGIK